MNTKSNRPRHIYAVPLDRAVSREGFQIVLAGERESARSWTYASRSLSGICSLSQDGDTGGTLLLDRLPSREDGLAIRKALGVFKRRVLSDEQRAAATRLFDEIRKRKATVSG